MKIAVVFDSAGTLLRMYRVAKKIDTGVILNDIVTTELVGKNPDCALLVMQIDSNKLFKCPPDMLISDFIGRYNVGIDVGCSKVHVDNKVALSIVRGDDYATMADLQEVMNTVKQKCRNIFYIGVGLMIDIGTKKIPYVVCTGGKIYSNSCSVIQTLTERGINVYIASGDSMRNLQPLANNVCVPLECVYEISTPKKKEEIVKRLKEKYDKVIMVGDGINDILAFRAADLSVLSVQQTGSCPPILSDEADIVIKDIHEVIGIVEKMGANHS
ncbi:MAG: HAD family hydrolase [Candidatus Methanoperedens sp.]|nr:HAD family hydrolase [Candidatus Methanoperedens sp.]